MNILLAVLTLGIQFAGASLLNADLYPGCLKPISSNSENIVIDNLKLEFVEVVATPPTPTTPGEVTTETAFVTKVLSIYENSLEGCKQRLAYIKFDTKSAEPAYVPASQYAIKVSGVTPQVFDDIVRFFNVYLAKQGLEPAFPAVNWEFGGFYLVFPAEYPFNEQMAIIAYTDYASCASYVNKDVDGVMKTEVTFTSEIFSSSNSTFVGSLTILPDTQIPQTKFHDYMGLSSQSSAYYLSYQNSLRESKAMSSVSQSDMVQMNRISKSLGSRCNMTIRCRKTKPIRECSTSKSLLQKYFSFVSTTIKCLCEAEKVQPKVTELKDKCETADDPISVFIAGIIKICLSIKSEADSSIAQVTDSVIGYNPFATGCDTTAELFDLSSNDAATIECLCNESTEKVEVAPAQPVCAEVVYAEETTEETVEETAETKKDETPAVEEQGFVSKHKVAITITATVVVVAGASVYAFVM